MKTTLHQLDQVLKELICNTNIELSISNLTLDIKNIFCLFKKNLPF